MNLSAIQKVNSTNLSSSTVNSTNKATNTEFSSLLDSKIDSQKTTLEDIFKAAADTYGINENLLKAVAKVESNFNPYSVSSVGAKGIMQLMPSTATSLGVTDPTDAAQSVMGGAKLLSSLLSKYNGDSSLALASYYAGSGAVDKAGGVPSYAQFYVDRVLSNLNKSFDLSGTTYTGSTDISSALSTSSDDGAISPSTGINRHNVQNVTYMTKEEYAKKLEQQKAVTQMIMNMMSATMGNSSASTSALSSLGLGTNTMQSLGLTSEQISSLGLDSATLSALGLGNGSSAYTNNALSASALSSDSLSSGNFSASSYLNMLSANSLSSALNDDDDATSDYMIY